MTNWIAGFIRDYGYGALAGLMFLENVFPPLPSELIMPFAGYVAARGELHPIGVVVAGSAGSLLGALAWYAVGYWFGIDRLKRFAQRHGRWLTLSADEVDQAQRWFHRFGGVAVGVGRLIPAVRSVISVPAGVARMGLGRFLLWSTVGTTAWSGLLTALGYQLGERFADVERWLQPVSWTIVVIALGGYWYRVARR
jgi:membrane protein DedA with SNARE-associated domain